MSIINLTKEIPLEEAHDTQHRRTTSSYPVFRNSDASMHAANIFAMSILKKDASPRRLRSFVFSDANGQENNTRFDLDFKPININNNQDAEMLIEVIQKPHKRQNELLILAKFFQDIPFFVKVMQKLPPYAFISLIKKLTYETLPEHKTIFKKNDQGDKYYIVLQGKVAILSEKNPDSHRRDFKIPSGRNVSEDVYRSEKKKLTQTRTSIVGIPNMGRTPKNRLRSGRKDSINVTNPSFEFNSVENSPKSILGKSATLISRINTRTISSPSKRSRNAGHSWAVGGTKMSIFGRNPHGITSQEKLEKSPQKSTFSHRKPGFGAMMQELRVQDEKDEINEKRPSIMLASPLSVKQTDRQSDKDENDTISVTSENAFEAFLEASFPNEKLSKELTAGVGFGDHALFGNPKRGATMVTMKETHFAVLNKANFEEIYEEFQEGVYKQNLEFLKGIYPFYGWSEMKISALFMVFDKHTYVRNNVIYSVDDNAGHIYIVRSGEVELIEMVEVDKVENPRLKGSPDVDRDLNNLNIKKRRLKKAQVRKVIAKLGPSSIFGEGEVLEHTKRRYTAVVASHHAEIFSVGKRKFFDVLKGTPAYSRLIEQYEAKNSWRKDFKKQLGNSIHKIEEDLLKANNKSLHAQEDLAAEHKLINTRLVILDPSYNTRHVNEGIRVIETSEVQITTPEPSITIIPKTPDLKIETNPVPTMPISKSRDEIRPESGKVGLNKAAFASVNLKKTVASLENILNGPKTVKTLNTEEQVRLVTSFSRRGHHKTHYTEFVSENNSPRIATKPAMPFFDLENDEYFSRSDLKTSHSILRAEYKDLQEQTLYEQLEERKAFIPPNNRPRKQYLTSPKVALEPTKSDPAPRVFRGSLYSKPFAAGEIMAESLRYLPTRGNSRSILTENTRSPERTFDFSNVASPERHRPTTAISTTSVAVFPIRGSPQVSPQYSKITPKGTARSDVIHKEFVNIHVQKRASEKHRPKSNGGFLLAKGIHLRRASANVMAVGEKILP